MISGAIMNISSVSELIFYLIFFLVPFSEGTKGIWTHKMFTLDWTLIIIQVQLVIYEWIIEIDCLGVILGISIADTAYTSPVKSTETHRARLAWTIDRTSCQLECSQKHLGKAVLWLFTAITRTTGSKSIPEAFYMLNQKETISRSSAKTNHTA